LAAPVTVHFENDQVAYLDPKNELSATRADVLDELHRASLHVYVEVDPQSLMIVEVRVPATGHVTYLKQDPGGELDFALDSSQRLFRLSPSNPFYGKFQEILRDAHKRHAMVILTENDAELEIVDVRLAPNPLEPALLEAEREAPAILAPRLQPVTLQRARDLFDMVNGQSCDPRTGAPPCIPFLYPHHGCHARAHQMCRLIIRTGDQPGKVWNFGKLRVKTPNEPHCGITWLFHVAPVLEVSTPDTPDPQPYIVDPSLFPEPVPLESWLAVQVDPDSRQQTTSPAPFLPVTDGRFEYDPTYDKTAKKLIECREALRLRCAEHGPPPYARCLEGATASAVGAGQSSFTDK